MGLTFPPRLAPDGRRLIDSSNANGSPIALIDYAFWGGLCVSSTTDRDSFISVFQTNGINCVHMATPVSGVALGGVTPPNLVSANRNGDLPLLKNNDGTTYTSTYAGNGDLSQYNTAYFNQVATDITAYQNAGIFVCFWPAYIGFGAGVQGWGADMIASGATKVNAYAAYIASVITQPNVIWMFWGDNVPSNGGTLSTINAGLVNTIVANAVQKPLLIGGHYPSGDGDPGSPNNTDTTGTPAVNSRINARTIYHWNASTDDTGSYADCLTACQASPVLPVMKIDPAGYEGDTSGGNAAPTTPTGVRTDLWWSLLTSTMGVAWANDFTQYAGSQNGQSGTFTFAAANTTSGLKSDGHKHLAVASQIYNSVPFWALFPAGVGAMGTIVTAGSGASGTQTWVASAGDPVRRSVIMCYLPPAIGSSASITIDMTKIGKNASAYWADPTNGARQYIGSFANTGTRVFTSPAGTNAYGPTDPNSKDWVLLLQATPDPLSSWIGGW